jgi:two-component system NtrC family sensor kinase
MRIFVLLILSVLISFSSFSQNRIVDSITASLKNVKTDTGRIVLLYELSRAYQNSRPDSALLLAQDAYYQSKNKKFIKGESWALNQMAFAFNSIGNFPKALQYDIEQLKIEEARGYPDNIASVYLNIALLYGSAKEYDKGVEYAKKADSIIFANDYKELSLYSSLDLGDIYEKKNILDSALVYSKICYEKSVKANNVLIEGTVLINLGNIYLKSGNFAEALSSFKEALPLLQVTNDYTDFADGLLGLAKIYDHNKVNDSAISYGKKSFAIASENQFLLKALDASIFLSQLYKKNKNADSAFAFQETMIALKDSIESREKISKFQNIDFDERMRVRELQEEKAKLRNTIKVYVLIAGIGVFMMIAFLLYRNNQHRKKTNLLLEKQKEELEQTLRELKMTQAQLIQSEKMASLGELTAGIAHEIQNPLNFVNNFSEVSNELIDELKSEKLKPKTERDEKLEDEILNDIHQNLEKINHHGKRADSIVKSMLEHSRKSTGQRTLTDINVLAEEFLRLSYHGVRVKDKSFLVTLKNDLDEHAGKSNIVPQDIGRVLLNIFNNAFYAVAKKEKAVGKNDYEPTVSLTTKKINGKIEIAITDNGNGIPQQIQDKIFQPFFTTKPTGEGTGLGLSICYDIIKSHGGELTMQSKEGEGTQFIIRLIAT